MRIIAPPIPALLAVNEANEIVPSQYALDIKSFGFDIITWTFERGDLRGGGATGRLRSTNRARKKDSDLYKTLDALARKVEVIGIFSDWPATVTYYNHCMGLQ